jgi:antitoxin component of RelBE/YafQ-DinJ toxin-antitoxin module
MEARIQFRIDEDVKRLAQQTAERKGITLSDACRNLTLKMAKEQAELENHEEWLMEQVENAYNKIESGKANFVPHDTVNDMLQRRLNKLRSISA